MQKEDYKEAVKMYSLGLDAFKDIKALWTNRALAYIKLKKYTKAIEDCTRVLDYCECFEDGYTQSRDSAFKVSKSLVQIILFACLNSLGLLNMSWMNSQTDFAMINFLLGFYSKEFF